MFVKNGIRLKSVQCPCVGEGRGGGRSGVCFQTEFQTALFPNGLESKRRHICTNNLNNKLQKLDNHDLFDFYIQKQY